MWLNSFKIAIATKNAQEIDSLLSQIPHFSDLEEAQKALFLVGEAIAIIENLQDKTSEQLQHLKKHIDFLDSTQESQAKNLDVKS